MQAALYVDTPERTVLRKLEWFWRGGEQSERQWRDVLAVIAVSRDQLDRRRMTEWAERLGVSDLLEKVFRG